MMRRVTPWFCLVGALVLAGCRPSQPFYFFEDGDLAHYRGMATEIEYPDVDAPGLADAEQSQEPVRLADVENVEYWDLSLEEAVQTSLANSKVMRNLGGTFTPGVPAANQNLSPTGQLLNAPSAFQTIYNPALVESDPRFGTEAALSAFDAQFSSSMFWERNDRPVNLFFQGLFAPISEQDLGTFRAEIAKTSATGGRFAIRQNTSYEWNNNPSNRFPSAWNTDIEAEFRHPLLQGAGVEFNRINGPNSAPGVFNGITIARINTDIALADFEAGVRNLVADVERAYWDLYFNYRNLDAVRAGRDSALETWRKVKVLLDNGAQGGEADKEAQAREQYYLFRSQLESSWANLYTAENRLRYMLGLAATDGRLVRPQDEPTTANLRFEWTEVLTESLTRNVELRRQKWTIKQRELQLTGSRNFLLPRLDVVGRYRWRGFGDDLLESERTGVDFNNAWEELTGGDFQEWQTGLQLTIPIGYRQQLAGVRNAQLALARERALLQEQELEMSHQMTNAVRDLDRHYTLSQTNFNRRVAAQAQVDAVEAAYRTGTVTLDLLLDAQRRLADAESSYFRSLVDYNLAIVQVHFRKGSLLEYNGVHMAEGPWPAKAYFDARQRARQRDAGLYMNYGFTRPGVFSRGEFEQDMGVGGGQVTPPNVPGSRQSAPGEEVQSPDGEPLENGGEEASQPDPMFDSDLDEPMSQPTPPPSGTPRKRPGGSSPTTPEESAPDEDTTDEGPVAEAGDQSSHRPLFDGPQSSGSSAVAGSSLRFAPESGEPQRLERVSHEEPVRPRTARGGQPRPLRKNRLPAAGWQSK